MLESEVNLLFYRNLHFFVQIVKSSLKNTKENKNFQEMIRDDDDSDEFDYETYYFEYLPYSRNMRILKSQLEQRNETVQCDFDFLFDDQGAPMIGTDTLRTTWRGKYTIGEITSERIRIWFIPQTETIPVCFSSIRSINAYMKYYYQIRYNQISHLDQAFCLNVSTFEELFKVLRGNDLRYRFFTGLASDFSDLLIVFQQFVMRDSFNYMHDDQKLVLLYDALDYTQAWLMFVPRDKIESEIQQVIKKL
jgi:hypothetical protein